MGERVGGIFLSTPVVEKEVVEISTFHLEGEAYDWWSNHLSHAREENFANFIQGLNQTFYGEREKEEKATPPLEEACDNVVTLIEEQPHVSIVGATNTLEEGTLAALQEVPNAHQGMKRFHNLLLQQILLINVEIFF